MIGTCDNCHHEAEWHLENGEIGHCRREGCECYRWIYPGEKCQKGCPHSNSYHANGVCTVESCWCGSNEVIEPTCVSCGHLVTDHIGFVGCTNPRCPDQMGGPCRLVPDGAGGVMTMERAARARSLDAPDMVNHPPHYKAFGVEVIDITEHLNFCRGNAVKYICRAGLKNPETELEDLEKAHWYLTREIERMRKEQ